MGHLGSRIAEYIQQRADSKLEVFDKNAAKQQVSAGDDPALVQALAANRREETAKFHPNTWLDFAASRAGQISLVSHALKYTHSDAKGSSFLVPESGVDTRRFVSTSLHVRDLDVVGNAAALDVANLLRLESEGRSLIDCIADGDSSPLAEFAESSEQLERWMAQFRDALSDKSVSSHVLAKQLYFPLQDESESEYHLLSPLFASSLAGQIHERLQAALFSEESKAGRKAKREGRFFQNTLVGYPNLAIQSYGGTKPQNISLLNSSRRGRAWLLPAHAPKWRSLPAPPMRAGEFWSEYDRRAWVIVKRLHSYLVENLEEGSTKARRDKREAYVEELVDTLLVLAAEIQALEGFDNWSRDSDISDAEKLFLDPRRAAKDEVFAIDRERKKWIEEIAGEFAGWINGKIRNFDQRAKDKKLNFADAEYLEWKKALERALVELKDDLEVLV